jgi:WD40 repeat protein
LEAHGGPVRSIAALPNENGFVTGSADHDVKFWEYQINQKPGQVWPSILFLLFMFVLYNFLLFASIFPIENSLHVNVIMLSFGA